MVQAELRCVGTAKVQQERRAEAKADGEGLEDILMDLVTALVKGFSDGAKPRHIIFVRPSVGVEFVASRTLVV